MTFKLKDELIPLNILTIALFLIIIFLPDSLLRIILGIPFILFTPGYSFAAALYPRKTGLSRMERLMWSFGLSIVTVPLLGLVLNYTPLGIRLYPVAITIAVFIFIMSAIAWYRRHRLPEHERFGISLTVSSPWKGKTTPDRVLSVLLVVAVLGVLGVIGYRIATPNEDAKFTELYVLNAEGIAADYPENLTVGREAAVIIGIGNSEYRQVTYRLDVLIDGTVVSSIGPITLEQGETWKNEVTFTPERAGKNEEVEFSLYEDGEDEPVVAPLHLWVNVRE
jgi:uncharacterized membrane protein